MRPEALIAIVAIAVPIVFSAGVYVGIHQISDRASRKDINGIGEKARQIELKLFYVAMFLCPEEKRQEILNALVRRLT